MARRMFVSIAVLLAVSMLLVPHGVSATGVGPAKPSDLVTLIPQGFCPSGGFDMKIRVLPDASEVPFAIPAGRVFVITGWQWGEIVTLMTNAWEVERLRLETPTTSVTVGVAGNSTPGVPGTTPFNQTTSNNASIVGMIVVKPGVQVCVSTESRGLG